MIQLVMLISIFRALHHRMSDILVRRGVKAIMIAVEIDVFDTIDNFIEL